MKTRNPPRWYVEWLKDLRLFAVVKDGFRDSTHQLRIDARGRASELNFGDDLELAHKGKEEG